MEFPLTEELYIVERAQELIPKHKFVNINIMDLSDEDIYIIQKYSTFILPKETLRDNFAVFKITADHIEEIYKRLSRYDLIIAPGDSPSKYILSLKLCGFKLPIIQFPISGLGQPE